MSYKEINLRAKLPDAAATEIMYEIAAKRADGVQLLRLNINMEDSSNEVDPQKLFSSVIKLLKEMKQRGSIQFFATKESFRLLKTESVFLQNKYPDIFSGTISNVENAEFIFIKL